MRRRRVGYDALRETLIIRDPSQPGLSELPAAAVFGEAQVRSPQAMVMTPVEKSDLLEEMSLPESRQYDLLHEMQSALAAHQRYSAQAIMDKLEEEQPGQRLTLYARASLCRYDGDPVGILDCIDRMLELYPHDLSLAMEKLGCLAELGRMDDRIALLREISDATGGHPLIHFHYAHEIGADARHWEEAERLLQKCIRHGPQHAAPYASLADVAWNQQRRNEALMLYRIAACLTPLDEDAAAQYFRAARAVNQTTDALQFLKDRLARLGNQSGAPARTLCWAFEELGRDEEAEQTLDSSLVSRPDDPAVLIFAARIRARQGKHDDARSLLLQAKATSPKTAWLRAAADLAKAERSQEAALARWREVVEFQPLAADAHQKIAELIAEIEGTEAAILHLRVASRRHPRSLALRGLLLEWVKLEGPESVEHVAREMLDFQPLSAAAECDLALALLFQHRLGEAFATAAKALQFHPSLPAVHAVWGRLHDAAGQKQAAIDSFRKAISLSVDDTGTIQLLLGACESEEQKREQLAFVYQEFERQTITGDGLLVYRELAQELLDPQSILEALRSAQEARPDLWHAWSCVGAAADRDEACRGRLGSCGRGADSLSAACSELARPGNGTSFSWQCQ